MSEASPPVGVRQHEEDRAAVLDAVREHGPCTLADLRDHLGHTRAGVMARWHLVILGDHGKVRWTGDDWDDRVVEVAPK